MNNALFPAAVLQSIDEADDLKVAPFRADGITYGTPTWIWAVVLDGELYVRAYSGRRSRWYQSAVAQKAGRIHAAGLILEVAFEPVSGEINEPIDALYRDKYGNSPYLLPMISKTAREATIRIRPQGVI